MMKQKMSSRYSYMRKIYRHFSEIYNLDMIFQMLCQNIIMHGKLEKLNDIYRLIDS